MGQRIELTKILRGAADDTTADIAVAQNTTVYTEWLLIQGSDLGLYVKIDAGDLTITMEFRETEGSDAADPGSAVVSNLTSTDRKCYHVTVIPCLQVRLKLVENNTAPLILNATLIIWSQA